VGVGKANVTGEVIITTIYRGDTDDSIIEFIESEIPFSGTIEIPSARDEMFAEAELTIFEYTPSIGSDQDGEARVIELDVHINAAVKVSSQVSLEYLKDAYCINKTLDIKKTSIKYPRVICRNRNQTNLKDIIMVDEALPDIMQVFSVIGKPQVDDVRILDDKVLAEGHIQVSILYVAKDDDVPLCSYSTVLPFSQTIETKGSQQHMECKLNTAIEHVAFNMLSAKEVEVRLLISFNASITDEREAKMITEIDFADMDRAVLDLMPTMTIYIVQRGDTLWKIAKQYNTSIDELLCVNEMDMGDEVVVGQRLLILKKIAEVE
jgi:hypothetical protein